MRHAIFALLFAASLYADCTASVFPPETKSLRFTQRTKNALFEWQAEMTWTSRRVQRDGIRWTRTFTVEDREPSREIRRYHCTAQGITPMAEGSTTFTGVQYGHVLEPGTAWQWTWTGGGTSASYDYRVTRVEKVTVPAGTFVAARVDYTAAVRSESRGELPQVTGTLWIAPGVGMIKQIEDDPALALVPEQTTLELVERQ